MDRNAVNILPIKMWLQDIEEGAFSQASNLADLPFAFKHVALMPDCHQGYGMPIGGVVALKNVISPNMVGVDIGCGMAFIQTNIPAKLLKETLTGSGSLTQSIVSSIMRNVPTGFGHHKEPQNCLTLEKISYEHEDKDLLFAEGLLTEIEKGYYQVGTLGGGNHFIELQEDESGNVAIMLHSGSRNFGYRICKYFNDLAKVQNAKWFSSVPPEWDLAFLPVDTPEGRSYIRWMNIALDFAMENRQKMLFEIKEILYSQVKKHTNFTDIQESMEVNAHHNYASLEHHFGKDVWVHRKGAIRARKGDSGIIPGAMGISSYIVEGLGNPQSFNSCSHGAGRRMGRKEAMRQFSVEKTILDLKQKEIVLGKTKKDDVSEECMWAYKDIEMVIQNEADLAKPIKKLSPIAVIKG